MIKIEGGGLGSMDSRNICNLRAALARMGGSVVILRQLAEFFYDDAPPLLARLQAGIEKGDTEQVHQAAHSLKGLLVNFDAAPAAELAANLEQAGKAKDLGTCTDLVDSLERELDELTSTLKAEIPVLAH